MLVTLQLVAAVVTLSSVALSSRRLRRHVPDIPTESHRLRDNGLRLDHQGGVVQELPSALEEPDLCQLWSAAGEYDIPYMFS